MVRITNETQNRFSDINKMDRSLARQFRKKKQKKEKKHKLPMSGIMRLITPVPAD